MVGKWLSVGPGPSSQEGQAVLRTKVLLLAMAVTMGLCVFDYVHVPGLMPGALFFYIFLFLAIGGALYLNRPGYYTLSAIVSMITLNIVTFTFALTSKALLLLFIPVSIVALVIISFEYPLVRWGFVAISYILFCIGLFTDLQVISTDDALDTSHSILFFVSVTTAIVCLLIVVQSYINQSSATEASLKQQQRHLLQLTDDLQRSQQRFEFVIKGSGAGIYEWNVKKNTLYISNEWKQILGYGPDELQEFSIADLPALMHPDDTSELNRKIKEHLEDHKPFQNESRRRHKNGTYRWVFDSGLSRVDELGNVEVVIGSIIDITERKSAELLMIDQNAWLKKTNQELDRLVHSASHDLRSPLSSVLGLLAIAEYAGSKEEIYAYHRMIRDRVKSLDAFITDVLNYSRNSNREVVKTEVRLAELVHDVVEELRYANAHVEIDTTGVQDSSLVIMSDYVRLKTVFQNLVGNSIKYSDPSKEHSFIKVEVSVSNGVCQIVVRDNGIGIDPERQRKVFDMFYRASESTDGSGLGLFITREIVGKLGGSISLTSKVGQGTTMYVRLPVD